MDARLSLRHELKVRLPVRLIDQLRSEKLLRGRPMQDTVAAALDLYFRPSR